MPNQYHLKAKDISTIVVPATPILFVEQPPAAPEGNMLVVPNGNPTTPPAEVAQPVVATEEFAPPAEPVVEPIVEPVVEPVAPEAPTVQDAPVVDLAS